MALKLRSFLAFKPLLAVIALAALGLRLWHLEDRPMHTDEAVHAVVLGHFLETGEYRYNPVDSHGPTLYYLSWPVLKILGIHSLAQMEAWHVRLIAALIGTASILSLAVWRKPLGDGPVLIAATLTAVSAPFVYYHRYFIHEGLFVMLSLLWLHQTWVWLENSQSRSTALKWGVLAGLVLATKETAVLIFVSLGVALLLTRRHDLRSLLGTFSWACLAFGAVTILLYSSFGTHPGGLVDLFNGLLRFTHRATGEGHEKPWWTYFLWILDGRNRSAPMMWVLVLAGVGFLKGRKQLLIKFLGLFSLLLWIMFAAIPYKTPWLSMDILSTLLLLAGIGFLIVSRESQTWKLHLFPWLFLLLALGLIQDCWEKCYRIPNGERNFLAYSPTSYDVAGLEQQVEALAARHPAGFRVQVISEDYWPLPWFLRHVTEVGYWNTVPETLNADVYVTSPALLPALWEKIGAGWQIQYFGLRPEVLAVVLAKKEQ